MGGGKFSQTKFSYFSICCKKISCERGGHGPPKYATGEIDGTVGQIEKGGMKGDQSDGGTLNGITEGMRDGWTDETKGLWD